MKAFLFSISCLFPTLHGQKSYKLSPSQRMTAANMLTLTHSSANVMSPGPTMIAKPQNTTHLRPQRRNLAVADGRSSPPSCDIDVLILLSTPEESASEASGLRIAIPQVLDAVAATYPTARFGLATFTSPYACNDFKSAEAVGNCFELLAPLQTWNDHEELSSLVTESLYGGSVPYGATWSAIISSALSLEVGWRPDRATDNTRSRLILIPTPIAGNDDRQTCNVARQNTPNYDQFYWPDPYPDPYFFRSPPQWGDLCRFYDRPIFTDAENILNNENIYAAFAVSKGYASSDLAVRQLQYVVSHWKFPDYLFNTYQANDIDSIVRSWTEVILAFAGEAQCLPPDVPSTEGSSEDSTAEEVVSSFAEVSTEGTSTELVTDKETSEANSEVITRSEVITEDVHSSQEEFASKSESTDEFSLTETVSDVTTDASDFSTTISIATEDPITTTDITISQFESTLIDSSFSTGDPASSDYSTSASDHETSEYISDITLTSESISAFTSSTHVVVKANSRLRLGVVVSGAFAAVAVVLAAVSISYGLSSSRLRRATSNEEPPAAESI